MHIEKFNSAFTTMWSWLRSKPLFLWCFVVPFVIINLYFIVVATDRYVSESKLVVKQSDVGQSPSINLGIFGVLNPTAKEDALFLKEYILSWDMLAYLDKRCGIRKLYEYEGADPLSRLWASSSKDRFLQFYRNHIQVDFDENASFLTVQVQAFQPDQAQNLNQAILDQSERFMNETSHKIAHEQMAFVENELRRVKKTLDGRIEQLIAFQNRYLVLDPADQAKAAAGFVSQMESQLASSEAEMKGLLQYLNEDALQVQAAKDKIEGLRQQIEIQKKKLSGKGDGRLNEISGKFLDMRLEMDFISDVYKTTLTALEQTRFEASKKLKNVVVLASPTLPEEAGYPRKLYNMALTALALGVIFGIISLVLSIIREHKE